MRLAGELVRWRERLTDNWGGLRFWELRTRLEGAARRFEVQLFLGELGPADVAVELYAEGRDGARPRS